jgi:hypothetical protein
MLRDLSELEQQDHIPICIAICRHALKRLKPAADNAPPSPRTNATQLIQ